VAHGDPHFVRFADTVRGSARAKVKRGRKRRAEAIRA